MYIVNGTAISEEASPRWESTNPGETEVPPVASEDKEEERRKRRQGNWRGGKKDVEGGR